MRPWDVRGVSTLILQVSKYAKFSGHFNKKLLPQIAVPRDLNTKQRAMRWGRLSGVSTAFPTPTRLHPGLHYSKNAPSFTSKWHPFNSAEERSLQRRERGKTSRTAQCEHTAKYKLAKKPYFLIYCSLGHTFCLSSIIFLNALTIRVCPERPHTLVSQL